VEYKPKWINIPKRADRHHAIRVLRASGVSFTPVGGALTAVEAASMEPRTMAAEAAAIDVRMFAG
jgi:hypothetical protein